MCREAQTRYVPPIRGWYYLADYLAGRADYLAGRADYLAGRADYLAVRHMSRRIEPILTIPGSKKGSTVK